MRLLEKIKGFATTSKTGRRSLIEQFQEERGEGLGSRGRGIIVIRVSENLVCQLKPFIDASAFTTIALVPGEHVFSYVPGSSLPLGLPFCLCHCLKPECCDQGSSQNQHLRWMQVPAGWLCITSALSRDYVRSTAAAASRRQFAGTATPADIVTSFLLFENLIESARFQNAGRSKPKSLAKGDSLA